MAPVIPCYASENSLLRSRREFASKPLLQRRVFQRRRPRSAPILQNSLLFSLLAGNLDQRRVRSRLPPPPPKLLFFQCFLFRRPGFEIAGHLRRFAAMPIGHAVRRDDFPRAGVGESGPLSLLPIDVVEYQKECAPPPRGGGAHCRCCPIRRSRVPGVARARRAAERSG